MSSRVQTRRGYPSALGLGEVLTSPHLKNGFVKKHEQVPRTWTDTFVRPERCMVFQKTAFMGIRACFRRFSKYHIKIRLGNFNAKVGREYFQTDNWE